MLLRLYLQCFAPDIQRADCHPFRQIPAFEITQYPTGDFSAVLKRVHFHAGKRPRINGTQTLVRPGCYAHIFRNFNPVSKKRGDCAGRNEIILEKQEEPYLSIFRLMHYRAL